MEEMLLRLGRFVITEPLSYPLYCHCVCDVLAEAGSDKRGQQSGYKSTTKRKKRPSAVQFPPFT